MLFLQESSRSRRLRKSKMPRLRIRRRPGLLTRSARLRGRSRALWRSRNSSRQSRSLSSRWRRYPPKRYRYSHKRRWYPRRRRIIVVREPSPVIISHGPRLSRSAREALHSHDLYSSRWRSRLLNAPSRLIRFIEHYHRTPGFQHVLRAYYASQYGRKQIFALLRLLRDLHMHDPHFHDHIRFQRGGGIDRDGEPARIAILRYRNRLYRVLPSGRTRIRRV